VMIQEKRGMLKVWNMLLVVLAFCLAIFGDFLTRSGVINSIHSFAQGKVGPWLLGFICAVTAASLALVFARLPMLRARTRLESLVSREATFLYNNLLLVALCLTILWGVAFPLLSQAVRGQTVTIARPYYDFFLRIFGLPLLLLMGIGPLVAWRRASLRALGNAFLGPALLAVATGIALIALGAGSSRPGLIAYSFSVFVLASIALEFARGTRARRSLAGGSWPGAFGSLVARNRRRYGGYVVHAAVVLLAIGVAGSSAYQTVRERHLRPGQSMKVAGYTLAFQGTTEGQSSNARELRTHLLLSRGGRSLGSIAPGKNYYPAERSSSNEVAIRHSLLTLEDVYVIADQIDPKGGGVYFKVLVKPLVNLIWLAGAVFVLGSLITLWPDAREERRLAARYRTEGALVRV
jgi:cytochrome c-type biogenesis protein CcmF